MSLQACPRVRSITMAFALLSFVAQGSVWAANNILLINTTGQPPLNDIDQCGFMDRVATEALRRIGMRLETVQLPAERGLQNVNAGYEDGEMSRVAGLNKTYPNLIQVPEVIMDWEFHAFAASSINLEKKWADLSSYSVAFIRGWKIVEKNVPHSSVLTVVKSPDQLFSLLDKQRTDVVVYERWGGLKLLGQLQRKDLAMIQPALARKKMYMYLHKKHKQLVPLLANSLKNMKADGSYQQIYKDTLGQHADP